MGIRGDSALVPWRPFFWNDAEVVSRLAAPVLGVGEPNTPRPLNRRCRAAEVGWTGTSARSSLLEAVCPLLCSAQLLLAPHPRARATKGAGVGERLLCRCRRPNPPQMPLLRKALHCCAAAAATTKWVGGWEKANKWVTHACAHGRYSVKEVGRCANDRRRPLGLLASMLHLWKLLDEARGTTYSPSGRRRWSRRGRRCRRGGRTSTQEQELVGLGSRGRRRRG